MLVLTTSAFAESGRRALIIAIGDYPRVGGWDKLSSARDAALIAEALRARGFEDISLLVDREATKDGILQAFRDLTDRSQPGDWVMLHFSGHGQQVWDHEDPSNPVLKVDELDGFDESLVPYDARDSFTPGVYEGEKHLVDDEIARLLTDLRAKLGPEGQLVFTVDACYSGSISRSASLAKVRGTSKVVKPASYSVALAQKDEGSDWSADFLTPDSPLASMAVISAARADQPNYETTDDEGEGVGSLSLALSRTFIKPFDRAPSLGAFFRYLQTDMAREAPYQSPQLEGQAERQLFGNALLDPGGFPVLEFGADGRTATLRAGTLSGMFAGTTIRLLEDGQPEDAGILGEVTESGTTTTTVTLQQAVADADPVRWKGRVEDQYLLFQPVKLAVSMADAELEQKVREAVTATARLDVVDAGAQLLLAETAEGQLVLRDVEEKELGSWATGQPDKAVAAALKRVEEYARAKYFWSLSSQTASADQLQLQVVPVSLEKAGNVYKVSGTKDDMVPEGGVMDLKMGDPFVFRVTNPSSSPRYVHIMGVDANDEVFLLLPDAVNAPAEFVVGAESSVYFNRPEWIFQLAEPPGKQLFLTLASTEPIDLRPVFRQLSGPTRSAPVPGGEWLSELLFGNTRSAGLGTQLETASVVVDISRR